MRITQLQAPDRRRGILLILASLFSVNLLLLRIVLTGRSTYAFLLWNLFLAWIPLICAWIVSHTQKPLSAWKLTWIPAFLWLLFFPNSTYILTDLGHLARISEWATLPLSYDVVMLLSFTLNGLLLGFFSLFIIEGVWRQHFKTPTAIGLSIFSLFLAGLGMYFGRFLRWNSWDLFHQPNTILSDLAARIVYPFDHVGTWGFTLLYSGLLIVIYYVARFWETER